MKHSKLLISAAVLMSITLAGCSSDNDQSSSSNSSSSASTIVTSSQSSQSSHHDTTKHEKKNEKKSSKHVNDSSKDLSKLNYKNNTSAVINVNGNHSNLKASDWKYNHVVYANLDSLNRTSAGNTAYLESRNVANDSLRTEQTVQPTGWHQKFVNRDAIINRGHEIAYSLSKGISVSGKYNPSLQSGDQNNLKNLFTQTAFSNQKLQTIYESKVRNALRDGKKVIFQVVPVFRGSELMARGVHLQALSTDGSLNFNVYIFNVQPGISFNYSDGTSKIDNSVTVPTPADAPSFNDHRSYGNSYDGNRSNYRRSYTHHYVRDAVIAGAVHHAIRRHYARKYTPRYHYYHRPYTYHRHYYRHYRF